MKRDIWNKGKVLLISGTILMLAVMAGCNGKADQDTSVDSDATEEVTTEAVKSTEDYEYHESRLEHDKEESVHVQADAYGTPDKITVSTTLKNPGEGVAITDYTDLSDIKNKEGDEEYQLAQDGTLTWENHGKDIRYEGISEKELPVSVKVTYYLNDQEVTAEELAGASGTVRIRFDYTNHTGEGSEIVPFTAITGLMLKEEVAGNITVTNGKLKSMDGDYVVLGYAVPGVKEALDIDSLDILQDDSEDKDTEEEKEAFPDYMEVSFEAQDFELDFTATILTNGILTDVDIEKLADKVDDLADGFDDLHDGTAQLANALKTLSDSGATLVDGAVQLQSGLESLNQALSQIPPEVLAQDPTMAQLAASVATLSQGSGQLTEGIRAYTDGVSQVYNGSVALNNATYEMTESTDDLQTLMDRLQNLKNMDATYENYGGIEEGKTGSVMFIIETAKIKAD